jgi:hypothetical protein
VQRFALIVLGLLFVFVVTGCGPDHAMHQLQDAQKAFNQQQYAKTYRRRFAVPARRHAQHGCCTGW